MGYRVTWFYVRLSYTSSIATQTVIACITNWCIIIIIMAYIVFIWYLSFKFGGVCSWGNDLSVSVIVVWNCVTADWTWRHRWSVLSACHWRELEEFFVDAKEGRSCEPVWFTSVAEKLFQTPDLCLLPHSLRNRALKELTPRRKLWITGRGIETCSLARRTL